MTTFTDGESGLSVRTKINESIAKTDFLTVSAATDLDAIRLANDPDLQSKSRSDLVTWWATNGAGVITGTIVSDGTVQYIKDGGASITDLSGLSPFGDVYPDHFAENTTPGTTNMTAAINSAIAYKDSVGGGDVHFRGTTYGVDRQGALRTNGDLNYAVKNITTNPVYLIGEGRGVTVIEPIASSTNVFHVVKFGQRVTGTIDGQTEVATLSKGGLKRITVKGNLDRAVPDASVSFPGGSCIDVSDGDGVVLDEYEAHNAYGYCVGFQRGVFKNIRNTNGILYNSGADCMDAKMDSNAASNANNVHQNLIGYNCGRQRNTASGTEVLDDQAVFDLRVGHSASNLTVYSTASALSGKWVVGIRTQHDDDAGTDNDEMDNMSNLSDCTVQMSGANTRGYQFSTYNQQGSNLTARDAVSNFYIRSYNGNYSNLVGQDGTTNLEIYENASEGITGNKFTNCDMRGGTSYDVRLFGTDGVANTVFIGLVAGNVSIATGTTKAQFFGGAITTVTDNGTDTIVIVPGRTLHVNNDFEVRREGSATQKISFTLGAVGNKISSDASSKSLTIEAPASSTGDVNINAGATTQGVRLKVGDVDKLYVKNANVDFSVPITGAAVQSSPADATAGKLLAVGASATVLSASPALRSSVGGTVDALTLTTGASLSSLPTGLQLRFRASGANTGAATIDVDGIGAVACRTITGVALPAGYIRSDVDTVAYYDGTYWVLDRQTQRGSNANGNYVLHADGSQVCTTDITAPQALTATGGLYRSGTFSWTYPNTYVSNPVVVGSCYAFENWVSVGYVSTTSAIGVRFTPTSDSSTQTVALTSIGRWF